MRPLALLVMMMMWLGGCGGDSTSVYEVRGRVVGQDFGGLALRIDHEPIPGYMEAMRMSFRLANPEEARKVEPGDAIRFLYVVSDRGSSIRDIEVLPPETELNLPDEGLPEDTLAVQPDSLL